MPPPVDSCATCIYTVPLPKADPTTYGYPKGSLIGECHSDRPVRDARTDGEHWSWPIVLLNNTLLCHDYKRKTP